MNDASVAQSLPREGEVIAGKYRIQRVLGQGGMGCVVAARHLMLNQDLAIKFLLPEGARTPQYVARFLREAQAAAAIKSEHVVRVVDMGTLDDGAPYMVMEYLAGVDLAARIEAQGPLPIAETVEYVLQACEALAEAHAAGLVHRDIKPSNLFLTRRSDGSPLIKLLDFGIAKATGAFERSLTTTGTSMGSPSYMSPEQIRNSKDVDPRSDIWSLGATLHELLTGEPPFQGTSFSALCAAIIADSPARLCDARPDAPRSLEAVILRCLEKDPARRFPDMAALARELGPLASPTARISIERISRVLSPHGAAGFGGSAAGVSVAPPPSAQASPYAQTAEATSTTLPGGPARARRAWLLPASLAGALLIGGLAFFAARSGGTSDSIASTHTSGSDSPTTAVSPPSSASPIQVTPAPPSSAAEEPIVSPMAASAAASSAPNQAATAVLPAKTSSPKKPLRPTGPPRNVDPFADQH